MKRHLSCIALLLTMMLAQPLAMLGGDVKTKEQAVASIERQKAELIGLSDQIWRFAETALRETRSSKVLADYAEKQGFQVTRGVAGMPTAFVASYGQGRPVIGILGEYDALPGISQKAQPVKEALEAGSAGHGCGHNLFGAASLGAAVAIKEMIAAGKLKGTIRFYGTPAEEAIGGKIYMARDGLFKDLDVCLAWHPEDKITADVDSSQAIVDFIVEFKGKAAHAAADPWNGRSALAALEFFTTGLNRMREFVKPTVRMHYVIQKGGDVPNVVPEYARLWCWIRDSKRSGMEDVLNRARKIAEGAALMAGVESKLTIQGGDYEMLANITGAKLIHAEHDLAWADRVHSRGAGVRKGYSTGDRRRGQGIERSGPASRATEKGSGGRVYGCWRCKLARSHASLVSDDRARGRSLARVAGGRVRRDVDRPQRYGLCGQDSGCHHGRFV